MKKYILLLTFATAAWGNAQTNAPATVPEERIEMLQRVGDIYFQDGDIENALETFQLILAIDPDNKAARSLIGLIYFNTSRYKDAIENMAALVEDYPEDFQALNNLAWVYATAKDNAYRNAGKALELAQQALVIAPYDHHVWSTLSEAYYVAGEYEKANRSILHLVNLASDSDAKITEATVQTYNNQIQKCRRAIEAEALLREDQ